MDVTESLHGIDGDGRNTMQDDGSREYEARVGLLPSMNHQARIDRVLVSNFLNTCLTIELQIPSAAPPE